MAQVISIHSFRGGTGKSNLAANVAAILAAAGQRVGVVDTDIQSPGVHVLFGLAGSDIGYVLNDYLWGNCDIADVAHDVTEQLPGEIRGRLYLIPSSIKPGEITRVLREGYDVQLLTRGLRELIAGLELDVLFIDTHPGINEETLLSMVIAHKLVVVLRPDKQDYEGTAVTVQIARELAVPDMALVVNKLPGIMDPEQVRKQVEEAYNAPVAAVLPHSDELMALASSDVFALRFPDSPVSAMYCELARRLMEDEGQKTK